MKVEEKTIKYNIHCDYIVKTSYFSKKRNRYFLVLRAETNFLIKETHDTVELCDIIA